MSKEFHGLPEYYLGAVDIWVESSDNGGFLKLVSPALNVNIGCPTGTVVDTGRKLSAVVPAFKKRDDPHGFVPFTCTDSLIEVFKAAQKEPQLIEKILAVTAAHKVLTGQ